MRETVASVVGAALRVLRSKNRDMRANVKVPGDGEDDARRTRGDRGVADGGRSSSSSGGGSGGRGEVVVEGAVGRVAGANAVGIGGGNGRCPIVVSSKGGTTPVTLAGSSMDVASYASRYALCSNGK